MESRTKSQKFIYWILTVLVALVFFGSGLAKLLSNNQNAEMLAAVGGKNNVMLLGLLELAIVVLWLIPRTGLIGTFLGIAYLGGAIAVHFVNNQPLVAPVIIQILLWLVAIYRFPELRQRLTQSGT